MEEESAGESRPTADAFEELEVDDVAVVKPSASPSLSPIMVTSFDSLLRTVTNLQPDMTPKSATTSTDVCLGSPTRTVPHLADGLDVAIGDDDMRHDRDAFERRMDVALAPLIMTTPSTIERVASVPELGAVAAAVKALMVPPVPPPRKRKQPLKLEHPLELSVPP
ncbi:hypothetical protein HK101_003066, partial [Irineochytrium annulatum]